MTGDMGDVFNAMKEESKERRQRNRDKGAEILLELGVTFTTHNVGAHIVVDVTADERVDYWPGTGRWRSRNADAKGFGIADLVGYIKHQQRRDIEA